MSKKDRGGIGRYYVHRLAVNYNTFGILKDEEGGPSATEVLSNTRNNTKINNGKGMNSSTTEALRKTLTSIVYPGQKGSQFIEKVNEEQQQAIRDIMNEMVQKYNNLIEINFGTQGGEIPGQSRGGGISFIGPSKNKNKNYKYVGKSSGKEFMYSKTLEKTLEDFLRVANYQLEQGLINKNDLTYMQRSLDYLERAAKRFSKGLETDKRGYKINFNEKKWELFINAVNAIIAKLKFPREQLLGDTWEECIVRTLNATEFMVDETTGELVSGFAKNTGADYKEVNIQVPSTTGTNRKQLSENTTWTDIISLGKRRAKVDILVENKAINTYIGFSAKNTGKDSIKIVESTPLVDLLAEETDAFRAHYYNVISVQGGIPKNLKEINDEVKRIFAVKGLQGLVANQKGYSADVLILNNRRERCVQIFSMAEIIAKLDKANDFDTYLKFEPKEFNIVQTYVKKESSKDNPIDAEARLTQLLAAIREESLTVSLKTSALSISEKI